MNGFGKKTILNKQTNKQLHQKVKINTSITNDLKW